MASKKLPLRSEVPIEKTWDMESVFPSLKSWEETFKEVEQSLPALKDFKGTLSRGADNLVDWFAIKETLEQKAYKLLIYGHGISSVDANNQEAAAIRDRASSLNAQFNAAISFAEPELLSIGIETLTDWANNTEALRKYKHYFDILAKKSAHVRSDEVEELLSSLADPFSTATRTHGILANTELAIEPVPDPDSDTPIELAHTNYRQLRRDPRRKVRKAVWGNYADAHLAWKNTMANVLSTGVKQQVFQAKARNYSSALEAALHANHIPSEVFHSLIDTYKANLPTWHRYWSLRKKVLKLKEMHIYDTRALIGEGISPLSFDQSAAWIEEGMQPMGEEYVKAMSTGIREQRWIDYAPNKGKRFGAFSMGMQGTHPFIMMSYNDDILGLSTLAHELGHSMHSYYTSETQPWINTDYGIFIAEVASNFNQALVRDYLLNTQTDPNLQIAVIEEAMNNFHRYFFTMPTLARFEMEIHARVEKGEALTADGLIDLMADLFSEGYGPDVVVDRNRVGSIWLQFSNHMYSNFYVFQYATGISGAHALADKVLNEGGKARDNYLSFLKAGSSVYPIDALKIAGVDMTTPEAVEKTFGVLSSYVDKLESLLL